MKAASRRQRKVELLRHDIANLRHGIAERFLGLENSEHTQSFSSTAICQEDATFSSGNPELHGLDAEGIAIATSAVDDSLWSYMADDDFTVDHNHPSSFLAVALLKLKPLKLKPPPLPAAAKSWVPGKYLGKAGKSGSMNGVGKLLVYSGLALVAGAAIGASLYLANPAMKMFSGAGGLLLKAGAFMGSALMTTAQCMAEHGLACPIKGLIALVKSGAALGSKMGGYGVKMAGKFLGKMLAGAVALGGLSVAKFGKLFKGIWSGAGKLATSSYKAVGKVFDKLFAGILGMAGFMFKSIGKLVTKFGTSVSKVFKKINLGGLALGLGLGAKKFGGLVAKGAKAIGKGAAAIGTGISSGAKALGKALSSPFTFGGLTLGLASLGKLSASLPKLSLQKQFFIKGVPKLMSKILSGPKALMLGTGVGLGALFSKLPGVAVPAYMKAGFPGAGELAMSMGGAIGAKMIGAGKGVLSAMDLASNLAVNALQGGWDFSSLGPSVVKFFEGSLWLAKSLFDGLGKTLLGGAALLGSGAAVAAKGLGKGLVKGVASLGKGFSKLAVGGIAMMSKFFGKLPDVLGKAFNGIGELFKGGYNLAGSMLKGVGRIGAMAVGLAKLGFGSMGNAMVLGLSSLGLKGFSHGLGGFFKMLGRGAVMGTALGLKSLKGLGKVLAGGFKASAAGLVAGAKGLGKLGKLGVAGLKSSWSKMKSGGLSLASGLASGAKTFGKGVGWVANNPRTALTAGVMLGYAAYMCFGGGMCPPKPAKPGWGMPGTHESSSVRIAEVNREFMGGKASKRITSRSKEEPAQGPWMDFKVPATSDQEVQADESRIAGGPGEHEPPLYQDPAPVNWERNIGDVQVVEIDRTPTIASVDFSSDHWTCTAGSNPSVSGHPTIHLNSPATSVRVQMFDQETGETNWDAIYFLEKPGILDASAKEVGSGGGALDSLLPMAGINDAPPGGWKSFNRLCLPPGDASTHKFEMKITRYPPTHSDDDVLQATNHIGTVHFKVQTEQDPTPPSERAARADAAALNKFSHGPAISSMDISGADFSNLSPAEIEEASFRLTESACRMQRHRNFWSEASRSTRQPSAATARHGASMQARSRRANIRQQAEIFFAQPARGPLHLATH